MLQKTLKTTTGSLTVAIPEKLEEVNLGQLMELQATENLSDLQAISILSGIALSDLQDVKDMSGLQIFSHHITDLSAAIQNLYNSNSMPKKVIFKLNDRPKTVAVTSNLGIEPAGAFFAARDVITDEINDHVTRFGEDGWREQFNPSLRSCALILAHYFYCPATGQRYTEHGAEQFIEHVKRLPFTDALPIAKYFFLSFPNLSKPRISFWHRAQLCWKKRLALNRFKSLATSILLTP